VVRGRHDQHHHNCLDRHLDTRGDQTAIIWEGNEPGEDKKITYANCTPSLQVRQRPQGARRQEGRPGLHLPAHDPRAGGGHARLCPHRRHPLDRVRGFSADSLADRIVDSTCKVVITADGTFRGKKPVNLKKIADEAIEIADKHPDMGGEKVDVVLRREAGRRQARYRVVRRS
jgi:acetyl-CoA synthetase